MNILLLIWHGIGAFYDSHTGVLDLLGVAAIVNMPKGSGILYGYLRSTLQSFIGSLKPHPEQPGDAPAPQSAIDSDSIAKAIVEALRRLPDPTEATVQQ